MTLHEFSPEIIRLYRGFQAENTLTTDRLQALFDGLGHHPLAVLRDAVTAALREPKLPWYDRLLALVEDAAEAERSRERTLFDTEAKRFLAPEPPQVKTGWARAHHRAITLMREDRREEAQELLKSIGSSADLTPIVPLDKGAWLRANGIAFGLWPPAYMDQRQLDHIGWPWPEWPTRLNRKDAMVEAQRQVSALSARG